MRCRICALAVLLALFAGCMDSGAREPFAEVRLEAQPDGAWLMDGRRVAEVEVDDKLRALATEHRRELNRTTRLVVRVSAAPGADYNRVREMLGRCQDIGINNTVEGR